MDIVHINFKLNIRSRFYMHKCTYAHTHTHTKREREREEGGDVCINITGDNHQNIHLRQ